MGEIPEDVMNERQAEGKTPNVIQLSAARIRKAPYPTFQKVIDGKVIECVDVDSLSPVQRLAWLRDQSRLDGK